MCDNTYQLNLAEIFWKDWIYLRISTKSKYWGKSKESVSKWEAKINHLINFFFSSLSLLNQENKSRIQGKA